VWFSLQSASNPAFKKGRPTTHYAKILAAAASEQPAIVTLGGPAGCEKKISTPIGRWAFLSG